MSLEILPVSSGDETPDIRAITEKELEITKNQFGNSFSVLSQQYRNLNNKEWSQLIAEVKISKKKAFKFFVLKSVHNAKTYTLSFVGESEDYEKYIDRAFAAIQTFMFYTSDKTVYKNDNAYLPPITIEKQLLNYEGTYIYQPSASYFNSLVLGKSTDGPYKAKEIRRLTKDGKTYTFEAELKVEEITDSKIVLATDAVLKFDPDMKFRKAIYELNRTDKGLSGLFKAKDSTFEQDIVNLVNQNPSTAKSQPKTTIDNIVQKPEQKKETIVESQPDEETEMENRTYDDGSISQEDEVSNIKRFGQGTMKRISEHELMLTLTSGKKISFKEKYEAKFKTYTYHIFGGYIDELNSFVLNMEDGWNQLVNRTTGVVSDEISYVRLEDVSPDKQWIFTVDDSREFTDIANGVTIDLFSISMGIKKVYSKHTGESKGVKAWYIGNTQWTSNSILEIERTNVDDKKIGTCWLQLQKGKWTLTNTKPVINSAKILSR